MELEALLEAAKAAPPERRIEYRDQIAAYGSLAIEGVKPWLADDVLAAFAVRVIEQVGTHGEPELATKALRAARSKVPPSVTDDVAWALQHIKTAAQPEPPPAPPTAAPVRRAPAQSTSSARRRTR